MEFQIELKNKVIQIEEILKANLVFENSKQQLIFEAMEYSLLAGGKRIRPMIMQETYHIFGGKNKAIEYFMTAIEMIHTYSLVHDDLPAMDDDDYRRGRKTTHIVYGEDMGILAGDALLNYAFEVAHKAFPIDKGIPQDESTQEIFLQIAKALQVLSEKAGVYGMIGGQVIDVTSIGDSIESTVLEEIFRLKTGALIEASFMIGAILAGATHDEVKKMEQVGYFVGMAFQIQDDILDVTSTKEVLGKPILSDEKNQKTTYVSLFGLEVAKEKVKEYSQNAIEILRAMNGNDLFLELLVKNLVYREY